MRGLVFLGAGLGAGCGEKGDPAPELDRSACDQYVECIAAVSPTEVAAALETYGDDSACWDSAENADLCAEACAASTEALGETYPEEQACNGGVFVPRYGHWTTTTRTWVKDDCQARGGGSDNPSLYGFTLDAYEGGFALEYDHWADDGIPPALCALDGASFACEPHLSEQDLSPSGYSATVQFAERHSGEFSGATDAAITYTLTMTCEGEDCEEVQSDYDFAFPCDSQVDSTAEADE